MALAGSRLHENRGLAALAARIAPGDCVLFGRAERAGPHMAALVNASAQVCMELDEGNQFCANHPAVHILGPLLATAEAEGGAGDAFLRAFVMAYELAVRVGAAGAYRATVHPFGTHMIVGACAGVARLKGLDEDMTARAIELAVGMSLTSSQAAATAGASVRNLVAGLTAHNGLLACELAMAGFSGEPGAMDTVFGVILGDRFKLPDDLDAGGAYILKNYFKRHACSRWNQAPIEAAALALGGRTLAADRVASVLVETFSPATRLNAPEVPNGYAGKHSIPFNVAIRLLYGDNGAHQYTDAMVADPAVRAVMARTEVREDPDLTAKVPAIRAARVSITLMSGETLSAQSDQPPGGFDNPFDEAELAAKFRALAGEVFDPERISAIEAAIAALPSAPDVRGLTRTLSLPDR